MDEILARKISRQLKILNFWITFFGVIFLVGFIIIGFLLYKVITFTHDVSDHVSNFEQKTSQTLNVKKQACDSDSLGSLLKGNTDACN